MITKRDFILRGSCFCEKYNWVMTIFMKELQTTPVAYLNIKAYYA